MASQLPLRIRFQTDSQGFSLWQFHILHPWSLRLFPSERPPFTAPPSHILIPMHAGKYTIRISPTKSSINQNVIKPMANLQSAPTHNLPHPTALFAIRTFLIDNLGPMFKPKLAKSIQSAAELLRSGPDWSLVWVTKEEKHWNLQNMCTSG